MPEEIDDLEAPETWDWAAAWKRPGVPHARVTVSAAFAGEDFDAVAACAEREGLSVTEYVRRAVLAAAQRQSRGG